MGEVSKAREINDYFNNIHKVEAGFVSEFILPLPPPDVDDLQITHAVVFHLRNINVSKSAGPNKIPAFTKPLSDTLTGPICRLCKAILQQKYLPQDWKTAAVVAMYMGGSRSDVGNF